MDTYDVGDLLNFDSSITYSRRITKLASSIRKSGYEEGALRFRVHLYGDTIQDILMRPAIVI